MDLVTTTVADLEQTVLRRHPTEVVVPSAPIVAPLDPPRIRQVLFNLLSNAAKHSPPGREVVVELRPPGDHRVEPASEDDGAVFVLSLPTA